MDFKTKIDRYTIQAAILENKLTSCACLIAGILGLEAIEVSAATTEFERRTRGFLRIEIPKECRRLPLNVAMTLTAADTRRAIGAVIARKRTRHF
jgi:hypothetical protein